MQRKVLLLEDDESIRSMLSLNLKRSGFQAYEAATGELAISLAALHPDIDLAVLDIMLPGINGIEVCKILREKYPFLGIIMLTARAREQDKITALESGADDYVTKPFSVAELMARVNSLLRRVRISTGDYKGDNTGDNAENNAWNNAGNNAQNNKPGSIKHGRFEIDFLSRALYKDGSEIALTPTEFTIIKLFMANPGRAFDRDEILTQVWGDYYFGEMKIVDVNIRRLRKKIEDDPSNPEFIETVWGVGYRWKEVRN
jgi:two-component system alkaline phosphatase synthesis response regulator PhoP